MAVFLSGVYYCVSVFWCAVARISKFLVKLSKSGSKIRHMLVQVYGDNTVKKTAVYKWVTCFSEGRTRVTDGERSGRPAISKSRAEQVNIDS
jgi:hypothetical protein